MKSVLGLPAAETFKQVISSGKGQHLAVLCNSGEAYVVSVCSQSKAVALTGAKFHRYFLFLFATSHVFKDLLLLLFCLLTCHMYMSCDICSLVMNDEWITQET